MRVISHWPLVRLSELSRCSADVGWAVPTIPQAMVVGTTRSHTVELVAKCQSKVVTRVPVNGSQW